MFGDGLLGMFPAWWGSKGGRAGQGAYGNVTWILCSLSLLYGYGDSEAELAFRDVLNESKGTPYLKQLLDVGCPLRKACDLGRGSSLY